MANFQGTTVTGDLTCSTQSLRATQGFQAYYAYWKNNISYAVNFSVRNVGAGAAWWCSACYNHSGSNSYGAGNESYIVRYSGTGAAAYTMHNYGTSLGGNVSWSDPNTYQLRITKNAGYYPGFGGCVTQVYGPT
jgi:hypothetical protein